MSPVKVTWEPAGASPTVSSKTCTMEAFRLTSMTWPRRGGWPGGLDAHPFAENAAMGPRDGQQRAGRRRGAGVPAGRAAHAAASPDVGAKRGQRPARGADIHRRHGLAGAQPLAGAAMEPKHRVGEGPGLRHRRTGRRRGRTRSGRSGIPAGVARSRGSGGPGPRARRDPRARPPRATRGRAGAARRSRAAGRTTRRHRAPRTTGSRPPPAGCSSFPSPPRGTAAGARGPRRAPRGIPPREARPG